MAIAKISAGASLTSEKINELKVALDAELARRGGEGSV